MRVSCDYSSKAGLKFDLLCLPLFEGEALDRNARKIDRLLGGQIGALLKKEKFSAARDKLQVVTPYPEQRFAEIVLVGLGKREDFSADRLRQAAGLAGRTASTRKASSVGLLLPNVKGKGVDASLLCRAAVEGVNLGAYFLDRFKSKPGLRVRPAKFVVLLDDRVGLAQARSGAREGLVVSEMQNHCRDLIGSPANVVTPSYLANEARKLGRKSGFKVQVLGRSQIEKLKMGAFLAVARAAAEPMKLIRIDYRPARRATRHVVLVGKGITFDSGGISLKPPPNMGEMKQDMGGAGVVLCAAAAVAQLKLPIRLTVLIPACENLPGGRAYHPGDVLTTCIGKTIEVISTDAEGRLILADALGYATKMKPDYLIDVATLTGAVIYALGHTAAATLGTSEELIAGLRQAGDITGEKVWQLPLWDDYEYLIESPIADIKNSGGKPAGTITAARLLKHFTGDIPWAHIDIAGMDLEFRGTQYVPKGASGYGVRLLTEMLSRLA